MIQGRYATLGRNGKGKGNESGLTAAVGSRQKLRQVDHFQDYWTFLFSLPFSPFLRHRHLHLTT